MADVQVTCITKSPPATENEHITHIGNPAANWKWPKEDVIRSIDAGTNTFYVVDPITRVRSYIAVVRQEGKAPFLRTHADGIWNDNLLALGSCP